MNKIIFSIIFSLFIALGASTIEAAVNEGNVKVALVKGDDDKKKKKKNASKKKCCATENGEKKCSSKKEEAETK